MLAFVRLLREAVGPLEELRVGLRVVGADLAQDRGEAVRWAAVAPSQAGPWDPRESTAALGRDGLRLLIDPLDRYVLLGAAHARLLHQV